MFNRNNFLLMVFVFVLTLLYLYLILPLSFDEVWCYGFSYNISNGLVPYRDFNMIVTPLYCFVVSLFLFFFGRNLFIMSFFNSIMLSFIFLLMYKKISYKAIFIYVFLLCFSAVPSYNLFCLLLFFILISLDENDCNYYVYSSLLVSAMFLTKQTVGIFFVIPLLYYNRNRLKSLIIFFIPIIIFFVYLLYNGAFYNFIDYCFLGMFDFSNKNSSFGILSIFEFIFIGISFIFLLKSNFKDRVCFFVLMFYIMFFPATNDDKHFVIGVVPFVVYLFSILNIKGEIILRKFSILFTSIFAFSCVVSLDLLNDNFVSERDINYFENYRYLLNEYKYDKLFIFSNSAYRFKLDNNIRIDKFDLINNGNMGYKGSSRYISEINKYCKNNKCLFLVGISELGRINPNQINLDILDFVYDNYDCIDRKGLFYFCVN